MILAVLGGSFDPVHSGHVALGRHLLAGGYGERLLVIPTARSPHKDGPRESGSHRLAMLRLAFAGVPGSAIDDRELRRGGVSYTADTLAELAAAHPGCELRLAIGQDNLAGFPTWRSPERILELASLLVVSREVPGPGVPRTPAEARRMLQEARLAGERLIWVGDFRESVSSTGVRAMLAAGGDTAGILHPDVRAYIDAHGLYRA
ncbi:nicotinate (nicotinamide) nucleotide adenylyltransferase [bacterium]|nr:nicotinate (nicotinamide) nucleotide adenylyltransferase [bacterium]